LLRALVPQAASPVLYVDSVVACGVDLFHAVCDADLEGIVAKRAAWLYRPEATSCIKIKNCDYSQIAGRWELFGVRRLRFPV
jgi:ATP-dependent DNA ligase